jgi:hypothetical protein
MAILLNRILDGKLFSSRGAEASSSSLLKESSAAVRPEDDKAHSSPCVLPKNLNAAIGRLDDQQLDRLVTAALGEWARRKKPPEPEKGHRKRYAEPAALSLPQGKLNAVKAAFKAGVTPSRIAREFGISQQDVRKALASDDARKQ